MPIRISPMTSEGGWGFIGRRSGISVANCRFLSNQSFRWGGFLAMLMVLYRLCLLDNQTDSSGSGGGIYRGFLCPISKLSF